MESESIFIDTSAFYALMDRSDSYHEKARNLWISLLDEESHLKTTNYIIIETEALLQSRLAFEAAHLYSSNILELVDILWVNESRHNLAFELWLSLGRKKFSFVDCVSFITMRHYRLENVFGFDRHFDEQGFIILD
ncbi:MAG: PIN domain-containing protein [Desulfobacterales bacterium]|jgi:predicted nucleic acid-binding protein